MLITTFLFLKKYFEKQSENKKKKLLLLIFSLAGITAASGTIPYGWNFALNFPISNTSVKLILSLTFALTAAFANAALGAYSLLYIRRAETDSKFNLIAIAIAVIGSIPTGFICFVGYEKILTTFLNILLSVTVIVVNAAINFTAIRKAINSIINHLKQKNQRNTEITSQEKIAKMIGLIIGLTVTLTFYLASTNGLYQLFKLVHSFSTDTIKHLSQLLAIIIWLPGAALFGNSTQIVACLVYNFTKSFKQKIHKISWINICIILLAILSAGGFAQMTIDFFNPTMNIPDFFKQSYIQKLIFTVFVPLSYLASAAVNGIALRNAYQTFCQYLKIPNT